MHANMLKKALTMKRIILSIFTVAAVMHSLASNAQTATTFTTSATSSASPNADTVYANVQFAANNIYDNISSVASGGVIIKWKVIATNFPADWQTGAALGVCDNTLCHSNYSNTLWNSSTNTGTSYTSGTYSTAGGDFHLALDLSSTTTTGKYYLTVQLADNSNANSTKTVTFLIGQNPTGVNNVTKTDDIALYPNPATDQVNVVYSADDNIKTIAIYNIIGKVVKVYNPLDNSSAKLNIENIPSGIYFVRLIDTQGNVVATRKFTRQ